MKTLNEQIERLKGLIRKCYGVVASKNGIVPEVGERNMENLPNAIASTHDTLEELTITQNGTYTPQEGVDGFSKVVAEFDTSSLPKVKVSSFKVTDACINEDGMWEGESLIDTSECKTFYNSFASATKLKQLDARGLNTDKVTDMSYVFQRCSNLESLNVSNWNTSNVTTMNNAFYQCSNLEALDVSNWDVSKVITMYALFSGCGIKSVDFSKWDISNCTSISYFGAGNALTYIGGRTIDEVLANNIGCLNGLKSSFYLYSRKLDRASLRALINGLADLTGQTAQTLTLGATLIAKLTEEDIAITTSKNWTVV